MMRGFSLAQSAVAQSFKNVTWKLIITHENKKPFLTQLYVVDYTSTKFTCEDMLYDYPEYW